ncbi:MAG: hypothetical protein VYE77_01465 [Planctomycetota bacterium]|nr:hypothetical protein [Planctomycetota bacterium]
MRIAALTFLTAFASAQNPSYFNYEAPHCHPIRVSADGLRLFTVNSTDHRLTVWSLANPRLPVIMAEIPVGQLPVSVTERTADEVWVVNNLSDSISVVSLSQRQVTATIRVGDEPADVAFAQGKAFVSVTAEDAIKVYDANSHAPLGTVAVFGKDPRALCVSPNGDSIYALIQRSGNGTTIVPGGVAPTPPPPTNPALPPPPVTSFIVAADNPVWSQVVVYTMPDNDLVQIDTGSLAITRNVTAIGTNNFDVVLNGTGDTAFIANTEARNLVRFEPVLRGHAIDNRITRVTLGSPATVTPIDLNPGINYAQLPNPAALGTALAEPMALVLDEPRSEIYIAAHGTDRIGVTDLAGNVVARIDLQGSSATAEKRGPRGLALHPTGAELYVYNRLSKTLTTIDRVSRTVLREQSFQSWDPESDDIAIGRKFLYDAKLAGNGTMSCASCHIDGDIDGLAWDLGDPGGNEEQPPPGQPFPFNLGIGPMHPMKGPMTTQTFKGLDGVGPLHWRGDKPDFQAFNPAFDGLMGGAQLSTADMNRYAAFATNISYPPNPHQNLDRSLSTTPSQANQQTGFDTFNNTAVTLSLGPFSIQMTCATCHTMGTGTNGMVASGQLMMLTQPMKVPHLRNLYRKLGYNKNVNQQSKLGFGLINDGTIDTLDNFVQAPQFDAWPANRKDDLVEFLMAFDTGTAPLVGYRVVMDAANQNNPTITNDISLMRNRATAGDIDLIAEGRVNGNMVGFFFDTATQSWNSDKTGTGPYSQSQLQALTLQGGATLSFTGVTPGEGTRSALDRDLDGRPDGDDATVQYGNATPGTDTPTIHSNSEPRIGNANFAIVGSGAPASALGFLLHGESQTNQTMFGATLLVDTFAASPLAGRILRFADPRGGAVTALPLPGDPSYIGMTLYFQYAWSDPLSPGGFSSSPGMTMTIRP